MNDRRRGLLSSGGFAATFSRKREKGFCGPSKQAETLMEARGAPLSRLRERAGVRVSRMI